MKILLTSDTQSEFSNLSECETSLQELLAAAEKYKPNAIIHAGDLKEIYNPVDLRVVKFWVRWVRHIVQAGHRFIILLGNHDRISQDVESKDWLDILRAAGAETVSQPKVKKIGDGAVAFLPFTPDKAKERKWAKLLAKEIGQLSVPQSSSLSAEFGFPKVLIFHTELQGAYISGARFGTGNTQEQLYMGEYDACFGGHLHCHQNVGASNGSKNHVAYIGSPFCQDWGEADQTKGHVYYNSATGYKQLVTKIPHWYNAETLELRQAECTKCGGTGVIQSIGVRCPACTPDKNAYIRSKVEVSGKHITHKIQEEEKRLIALYGDARLFVIPKLTTAEDVEVQLTGNSDTDNVAQYVAATLPEAANFASTKAVAYLVNQLKTIDPGARGKQLRVLKVVGTNVLSFKKVVVRYHNQGLVLLKGKNLDWPKRSNGAGKTNVLGLLPAAAFGQTLKGQVNDQLANENTKGLASFVLYARDEKRRLIKITRTRRPHGISMSIDSKEVSTGLTGKGKHETQGQIESALGYDYKLLINAVYIDQTIANGFVFGTQKDRMDLVNKLLDLDRFVAALKLVNTDTDNAEDELRDLSAAITKAEDKREELEQELAILNNEKETVWETRLSESLQNLKLCMGGKNAAAESKPYYDEVQTELDDIRADIVITRDKLQTAQGRVSYLDNKLAKILKLIEDGKCTNCGALTTKNMQQRRIKAVSLYKRASARAQQHKESLTSLIAIELKKHEELYNYKAALKEAEWELQQAQQLHASNTKGAEEESKRNQKVANKIKAIDTDLIALIKLLKSNRKQLKQLHQDLELYAYARKAFNRSGMPMYLAAGLCPLLNQAAADYAEIFNSGRLQVRFDVSDGEFQATIINTAGSKTSRGQSVGESAMAGIITAFAIREAAPKTNVVILDEPGNGLDVEGQKQFAQGILKLKGRWSTIILTTHSTIIESILAGETTWTVEKRNKLSRLVR